MDNKLDFYGARPTEWAQLACQDNLAAWALPVVSNTTLKISARSSIKQVGKLPSVKNRAGEITGIKDWPNAPQATAQQIMNWSRDSDLGFCVRTGHQGLLAIDVDVEDPQIAASIEEVLIRVCHINPEDLSKRQRGNARWATLVQLDTDQPREKQVITLKPTPEGKQQAIEILGTGQQLVCAGTHPSGNRYTWSHGIVPVQVREADFQQFLNYITLIYAEEQVTIKPTAPRTKGQTFSARDPLASWLFNRGIVKKTGSEGELFIRCPWEPEHTHSTGDLETVYFPIGSNGYTQGGFKCLHAHCAHRGLPEFIQWAKTQGFTETTAEEYPDETRGASLPDTGEGAEVITLPVPAAPTNAERLQAYVNEKTGYIEPCATAVFLAVSDPAISLRELAFDTFRGRIVTRVQGEKEWKPYTEDINLELRINLEASKFRPGRISKELISDAVKLIANANKVDVMKDFLDATLPEWDGVPRAERFLATYCGAQDTEYTRAVGRYFWGLLWRRASSPVPIKADISLVLIGAQGANKTRFIKELTPMPDTHTELNFNLSASELAMRMGGRIVAEFPEMIGFGKRKLEEIKAFLTLDADTYRPLYSSDQRTVTRRCLFIMTTNNTAFLSDRTGNRRYAPIEVDKFNAEAIRPDILQLWAEGKEIFKRYGGLKLHRDIEAITEDLNENYVLPDSWETAVGDWLTSQEAVPAESRAVLQSRAILNEALGFDDKQVKREDLTRLSEIMQSLGYIYRTVRAPQLGNKPAKIWVKK